MIIDTHAHIYLPEFDLDRKEVIERAKNAGVDKILLPNIDVDSIKNMLQLSEVETDYCFPMMGLHPCSVNENYEGALEVISKQLSQNVKSFIGIGECGLDFFWDKTFAQQQVIAFEYQIELAKKYKLPLSIHSRNATDECISLIAKHKDKNLQGVFHCFSGTEKQLNKIIDLGFYIGIGGVVTFKNSGLENVLIDKYLTNIVIETDAPYLAPIPFRGKRNEPSYLPHTISKIAAILRCDEKTIIEITFKNAITLFKLH